MRWSSLPNAPASMNAISSVLSVSTGADVDGPFGADVEASCTGVVVGGGSAGADVDVTSAGTVVAAAEGGSVVAAATDVGGGGEAAAVVGTAAGVEARPAPRCSA